MRLFYANRERVQDLCVCAYVTLCMCEERMVIAPAGSNAAQTDLKHFALLAYTHRRMSLKSVCTVVFFQNSKKANKRHAVNAYSALQKMPLRAD